MSRLRAYYAALAAANATPLIGPLRTLRYDDRNLTFFSYAGNWTAYDPISWPGGAYNNSVTARSGVLPTEPALSLTTPLIPFAGSAGEGISLWGASESWGPVVLSLRRAGEAWQQFGNAIGIGTYRCDWLRSNRPDDNPANAANYDFTYLGESYYDRLGNPGMIHLHGLPAGSYQFRLDKPANTNDYNESGNRATYFDGATVYTCHPTFS